MAMHPYFHDRPLMGFHDFFWPALHHDPFKDFEEFMMMPVISNLDRTNSILRTSSPGYEIHEVDGTYQISVDVPGIKAADLNVKIVNDGKVLHISGGRKVLSDDGKTATTEKFSKHFTIGSNMDMDKLTAQLENGVLTVKAPIKEEHKPKVHTIPITEVGMIEEKKVDL